MSTIIKCCRYIKMIFLKRHKYNIFIFLIIAVFAVSFILVKDEFGILSNREAFQNFIFSFGALAPLVIIFSIIIEVVIAPLPGFVPIISAGFIFGPFEGAIYTYIGNIVGSVLVFWLSRKLGKIIVLHFVDEKKLDKYEIIIAKRENILLALYMIPFVPIDALSGAFGLSAIKFKKFIIAISAGYIVNVSILNFFGDYLANLYFV